MDAARAALAELAALASAADGFARPKVPELGAHALADQVVVLTSDALAAGADAVTVDAVLVRLASELGIAPAPAPDG